MRRALQAVTFLLSSLILLAAGTPKGSPAQTGYCGDSVCQGTHDVFGDRVARTGCCINGSPSNNEPTTWNTTDCGSDRTYRIHSWRMSLDNITHVADGSINKCYYSASGGVGCTYCGVGPAEACVDPPIRWSDRTHHIKTITSTGEAVYDHTWCTGTYEACGCNFHGCVLP